MNPSYNRLPNKTMQRAAKDYIEHGKLYGDFLQAVLEDSLTRAYGRADQTNREHMNDWVLWLYNDIPRSSWGDKEAVNEWIEHNGLEGLE